LPTYHISGPEKLEGRRLQHRPVGGHEEIAHDGWLPDGPVAVGLTAGASTPNNVVGEVILKVLALRDLAADDLAAV
jgi:4-hydroxy-3-methylbut-2-enyl diphosphate reductase